MTDLLVQRLKNAKRELTALKTAHRRGLGNLKTYYYKYNVPSEGHEEGYIWHLVITVHFNRAFAAYPFAQLLGARLYGTGSFVTLLDVATLQYIDDGYGLEVGCLYEYDEENNTFVILSSAPVDSISYEWSR